MQLEWTAEKLLLQQSPRFKLVLWERREEVCVSKKQAARGSLQMSPEVLKHI